MNLQLKKDISATAETTRQTRHRLAWPLIIIAASFAASALPAPVWAATIQGTTFMDRNDNGLKDSGEPARLTKTTLFIRHNPTVDAGEGGFYTTETDENGNYSFILHNTGPYTIWSEMPHGWHQTAPIRGEGIAFYDFTASNNEQTVTIDFGFIEPTAHNGPQMEDNPTSQAPTPTDDKAEVTATSGSDNTPSAPIWNGTVQGTTFMDENNNGLKDSGEPARLTKTTLFIRHNPTANAGEGGFYTTEADENGNYSFILYDTGSYTIWSEMPHGWHQTAPIRGEGIAFYDFTVSNNEQTVTIDFGFIEPTAHNGPQMSDNSTSSAPNNNTTESAPNTDPTSQVPTSTDDKADVTPTSGSDNTPSASIWNGTVQGTTFMDENNNGLKDSGEPARLTKTTLFIRHNPTADAGEGGFYTTETDKNGNYSFILYDTGSYTIWAGMPHGWHQTAPIRGEGIAFYDFTVSNNEQTVTIDFGFIEPTADNGPQMEDNPTSQAPNNNTTEPAPNTEATSPAPTSTDDKADVTPTSGSDNTPSAPTWNGTVQGTTFMDENNNGLKNSGEPARLTKTTIFIRHNPTADAGEGGFYTTETDENGNYSFILYDTGSYTIWSEMPHGWEQTAPIRGEGIAFYDFTLSNNQQAVTIDFGFIEPTAHNGPQMEDNPTSQAPTLTDDKADVTPTSGSDNTPSAPTWNGTVQGTTFMDENNNGLKDSGEPAHLTKTTLFIRHNPTADAGEGGFYTTETDKNGNYSFILYDTGSYTIWSGMPHGWEQTAPIRGEGIAFYDFTLSNNEQAVTIDFGFIEPTAHNGPQQPNKTPYSAEFSHTQHIIGEPNTQLPISLALFNTGPNNDTYTINVANTAAWDLTSSDQALTIKSQQRENLELNITLPPTHGAETRVTVTAQSQNDPKVEAVATFPVSVTAQQLTTTPRGDEEADLTLVIEDTALMAGENLKIANALENILAADFDAKTQLTFELITFKGNNIVSRLVTQDMGELIGLLRSLIPAGGDDCANASIAALDSALPYIYNGQILLATAAPPHNTDTAQLIAQAQQQATKINILLAGTCGEAEADTALYKNIADKTGGTFQWLPRGLTSPEESQQAITTTIANLITELLGDNTGSTGDNTGNTTGDNTGNTTGDNTDTQNIDATIEINIPTPATCQLYGVMQDSANNRTIFAYEPQTDSVSQLADVTEHGQMPTITAHPDTNTLYIASQSLSKLDAQTGQLTDMGDTGHQHITSLAFDYQGNLLAWAQGAGLIQIDTETAQSTVVLPTQIPLEDFTANLAGDTLYGLIGPDLWRYDPATHDIAKQCDNLPDAAKVIKVLPETILAEGLVLLGMHQDNMLNLHIFDINNCRLITNKDITMPTDIKKLGKFTVPMGACRQ